MKRVVRVVWMRSRVVVRELKNQSMTLLEKKIAPRQWKNLTTRMVTLRKKEGQTGIKKSLWSIPMADF